MFLGRYEHTIDGKGRLAIPTKYRAELGDGMIVTRGLDDCLVLYTSDAFQELAKQVEARSVFNEDARNLRRVFYADATDVEFDKQGRITLPMNLREIAGISQENTALMIVGNNTYIEIWNKERWQVVQERVDRDKNAIAARQAD